MNRRELAEENFLKGYNCSQSVVLAFSDLLKEEEREMVLKISSGFGGGFSRLREVCGAVSGMVIIADALYGYTGPEKGEIKKEHYERIQFLAKAYEEKCGSYICRDLLGLRVRREEATPEKRTESYYKKRPCKNLCGTAAEILEDFIKKNPIN